jgi:carbon monoxide dehydrogenase subunit G
VRLEKQFDVKRPVAEAARLLAEDQTLTSLFPAAQTEIVERSGERKTARTRYRALGREGVATFHFHFEPDGNVRFEKVCDGKVWRELQGAVRLVPRGDGTRVRIELEGRTRPLVPEFTIRGPMQQQIEQMAGALRRQLRERGTARKV